MAIGVDYDEAEEEFTIYLQGLNFSNVAKQEGTRSSEPIPNLIGVSKGKTINLAVGKLYKKSKPTLFYGHIKSVVVTESVLQHTFDDVLEVFGRNRSLRPNMLFSQQMRNLMKCLQPKACMIILRSIRFADRRESRKP